MMAKTQRIRIGLVTDLDDATVAAIGCEKISVDQARREIETPGSVGRSFQRQRAGSQRGRLTASALEVKRVFFIFQRADDATT